MMIDLNELETPTLQDNMLKVIQNLEALAQAVGTAPDQWEYEIINPQSNDDSN
jgi:hypothetical protein